MLDGESDFQLLGRFFALKDPTIDQQAILSGEG